MTQFRRLTPAQSAMIHAGYRAMLALSQRRRREFQMRRDWMVVLRALKRS